MSRFFMLMVLAIYTMIKLSCQKASMKFNHCLGKNKFLPKYNDN